MKNGRVVAVLVLGVLAFSALSSSIYVLPEAEQALVVRLGRPLKLRTRAGLKFKLPFIDTVNIYNVRLLSLTPPTEQIILGDQKRIQVDSYTEFRIKDPLRYAQSVQTLDQAQSQLTLMVGSSLRRVLGQATLPDLLSDKRTRMTAAIKAEAVANARPLGIEIVDVQIRRVNLPDETSQAIYDRMTSERQREAKELRAQGYEWAQSIDAQADGERTRILAEAQEAAQKAHGEGDAAANQLFADDFRADPQFFKFYRAMQSYGGALADSAPVVVLTPNSDVLRFFNSDGQKGDGQNGSAKPLER